MLLKLNLGSIGASHMPLPFSIPPMVCTSFLQTCLLKMHFTRLICKTQDEGHQPFQGENRLPPVLLHAVAAAQEKQNSAQCRHLQCREQAPHYSAPCLEEGGMQQQNGSERTRLRTKSYSLILYATWPNMKYKILQF